MHWRAAVRSHTSSSSADWTVSGVTRPKHSRKMFARPKASLKRISPQFSIRTSSSCRLLFTCVILIATTTATSWAQQRELPTVIVRGFLNYRTTVDGTVLLFTPDAGQQQPPASASVQTRTSQVASLATSSIRSGAGPSSVLIDTLAMAIEPTSVQPQLLATEPPRSDHSAQESNSFRPVAQTNAANSVGSAAAAQPNEWRPIQATPPLKLGQMSSSLASGTPNQANTSQETPNRPSVQADDVLARDQPRPSEAPTESRAISGRLRRPSLGFNGQGLKPQGGASPSTQSRTKPELAAAAAPSNSINGIRRPGLTSSSTSPPPARSQPSELAATANVSSAFQSRLTNASARLRNRFKHRQPAQGAPTPSNGSSQPPQEGPTQDSRPRNSLVAPESLLDVSASIEQPTEAARSQALAPQSDHQADQLAASSLPAVGSDEPLTIVANGGDTLAPLQTGGAAAAHQDQTEPVVVPVVASNLEAEALSGGGGNPLDLPLTAEQQAGTASLSRSGEQQPPRVISGQLMQGSLSSGPLSMDNLFLSDQPAVSSIADGQASSELVPSHAARPLGRPTTARAGGGSQSGTLNGKLNGWLGQHHNKFVPRPSAKPDQPNLSHQLANNLHQLNPTPPPVQPAEASPLNQTLAPGASPDHQRAPAGGTPGNATIQAEPSSLSLGSLAGNGSDWLLGGNFTGNEQPTSMQTITKTYSAIMETTRTRIVPMQVDQATAIYTITEDFLMTKLMTAYQTIPAQAVFILADQQLSTRAPFEVFESSASESADGKRKADSQPAPVVAAPAIAAGSPPSEPTETQEQPISLDNSPRSANNWLHDFSNLETGGNSNNPLTNSFNSNSLGQQQDQQQQAMLALLEQQARDANLAPGFPLMSPNGETLDQLASQLDPTALLADGAINIPDLNNPLVLAAAIQNPQLAAVILAAQQLKLKRQQQLQQKPLLQQQQQPLIQLQPSYSTSFSTTIRPSTYTARDTMYTTRLVSFRDGRTVRTRTVSEPGSVVEQVLTTMVTETIPFTITIKPTGVIGAASSPATSLPASNGGGGGGGPLSAQSNQATINNALFATQLANILSRRQQQLQTSFNGPASLGGLAQGSSQVAAATPQQLLALQQYLNQQQKRQQPAQQAQQQFQPNFQQLLQSLDNSATNTPNTTSIGQPARKPAGTQPGSSNNLANNNNSQATPALQQTPKSVVSSATPVNLMAGPITTTLTSIQTRTYTVHNAFKTIFRTITSTILITTVLNAGATLMPTLG